MNLHVFQNHSSGTVHHQRFRLQHLLHPPAIERFIMKTSLTVLALLPLAACASITDGSSQPLSVTSSPSGAECKLTNDKGDWYVNRTPDSVTVKRSSNALAVTCKKGGLVGATSVESTTRSLAFGNILAGGIIGAAVDNSTGAAFNYPQTVHVKLGK